MLDTVGYDKIIENNGFLLKFGKHGKLFDVEDNHYIIDEINTKYHKI